MHSLTSTNGSILISENGSGDYDLQQVLGSDTNILSAYLLTNGNGSALIGIPQFWFTNSDGSIRNTNASSAAHAVQIFPDGTVNFQNSTIQIDSGGNLNFGGGNGTLDLDGNVSGGNFTGNIFNGSGSGLTSLNASRLSTGTVPQARLATNSSSDGQILSATGPDEKWVTPSSGISLAQLQDATNRIDHSTNSDFSKFVGNISSNQISYDAITNAPPQILTNDNGTVRLSGFDSNNLPLAISPDRADFSHTYIFQINAFPTNGQSGDLSFQVNAIDSPNFNFGSVITHTLHPDKDQPNLLIDWSAFSTNGDEHDFVLRLDPANTVGGSGFWISVNGVKQFEVDRFGNLSKINLLE